MSNHNYMQQLIRQGQEKHGEKFDASDLDERFASYYFSKERIKVLDPDDSDGKPITGTVSLTTGHKPIFILMRNSRAISSRYTLSGNYSLIAVKKKGNKKYSKPYPY